MKTHHIFLVYTFLSFGCQEITSTQSVSAEKVKFHLDTSLYSILNYSDDMYQFNAGKPSNLNDSELIKLESILTSCVLSYNLDQKEMLEEHNRDFPNETWTETGFEIKLNNYRRQYLAIINSNNQKEVWINFFCDNFGAENWRSEPVDVLDGGNCYVSLKINLTTGMCYQIDVNGYA